MSLRDLLAESDRRGRRLRYCSECGCSEPHEFLPPTYETVECIECGALSAAVVEEGSR